MYLIVVAKGNQGGPPCTDSIKGVPLEFLFIHFRFQLISHNNQFIHHSTPFGLSGLLYLEYFAVLNFIDRLYREISKLTNDFAGFIARQSPNIQALLSFRIICICFVSVFIHHNSAYAQGPVLANHPQPEILSSSEFLNTHSGFLSYDIEVDSLGYVYFLGPDGLRKFNGSSIKMLSAAKGRTTLGFSSIFKDYKGMFWLHGRAGLGFVRNDTIHTYSLDETPLKKHGKWLESFYRDSLGTLHISPRDMGYFSISSTGRVTDESASFTQLTGFGVTHLSDGTPFLFSVGKDFNKRDSLDLFYVDKSGKADVITRFARNGFLFKSYLVEHADKSLSLSPGNKTIIRFFRDSLIHQYQFKYKIIELFTDSRNTLWVGTLDQGFFKVTDNNFENSQRFWKGAAAVTAEDQQGGLWVKSDSTSFGYLPHPNIDHFSKNNAYPYFNDIHYVMDKGEQVICAAPPKGIYTFGDSISYFDIPTKKHEEGTMRHYRYPLNMCYDTVKQYLWIAYKDELMRWDGLDWRSFLLDPTQFSNSITVDLKTNSKGELVGATTKFIYQLINDSISIISKASPARIRSFDLAENGKIWVNSHKGVWVLKNKTFYRPLPQMPPSLLKPCAFIAYTQGCAWVQSIDDTLYQISDSAKPVRSRDGKYPRLVSYSVAPNGDLWGFSGQENPSLYRIRTEPDRPIAQPFAFNDHGVQNSWADRLVVTEKAIYSATNYGLFTCKLQELQEEYRKAIVVIDELRINHKKTDIQTDHTLSHTENYLHLIFDAIGFRKLPVTYRHRLRGLDSTWLESEFQQVQYTNLSPGFYEFTVQAKIGSQGAWSNPQSIKLRITPPYWKTTWFRLVILLVVVGLVALASILWTKRVRRNEQMKAQVSLEMSRLELRALKAQINPHFIFNAISSVMFYLSQNQADDAESYLERFSRLIRMVLEKSEKSSVPLNEEIELLRHYVSLESERFDGAEIEFDVAYEGINPEEVNIPPALFQPYIENAIWHGLKPKKGQRLISLSFSKETDSLLVLIEDNGIGRAASAKIGTGKRKHRSLGMMITSRRIEILNRENLKHVEVEDIQDTGGQVSGTRIRLYIPLQQSSKRVK